MQAHAIIGSVLVVYISGHGFGHASRTIEVCNALLDRRPSLRIVIRSCVAPWLVALTARPGVLLEPADIDPGIVQIDSLRLDEAATLARARAGAAALDAQADAEAARLRALGAAAVLFDIPALAPLAAARAGIPSVALGNFTWDWIYAAYDGAGDVAAALARAYAQTTLALRLPMCGGFETVREVRDIPFVAPRATCDPGEVRDALDLPRDERLVLVSFGGYGVGGLDLDALARLEGYRVVIGAVGVPADPGGPPPGAGSRGSLLRVDESRLYARGCRYEDLVRAVDVVVTKPGYGIIAACVANERPMLYTSRGRFREYEVLTAAMPRILRCRFIERADLLAGRWRPHLDALLVAPPPPERPATDGAAVAAGVLAAMIG